MSNAASIFKANAVLRLLLPFVIAFMVCGCSLIERAKERYQPYEQFGYWPGSWEKRNFGKQYDPPKLHQSKNRCEFCRQMA